MTSVVLEMANPSVLESFAFAGYVQARRADNLRIKRNNETEIGNLRSESSNFVPLKVRRTMVICETTKLLLFRV